jgi:hypothetical protein
MQRRKARIGRRFLENEGFSDLSFQAGGKSIQLSARLKRIDSAAPDLTIQENVR